MPIDCAVAHRSARATMAPIDSPARGRHAGAWLMSVIDIYLIGVGGGFDLMIGSMVDGCRFGSRLVSPGFCCSAPY